MMSGIEYPSKSHFVILSAFKSFKSNAVLPLVTKIVVMVVVMLWGGEWGSATKFEIRESGVLNTNYTSGRISFGSGIRGAFSSHDGLLFFLLGSREV